MHFKIRNGFKPPQFWDGMPDGFSVFRNGAGLRRVRFYRTDLGASFFKLPSGVAFVVAALLKVYFSPVGYVIVAL